MTGHWANSTRRSRLPPGWSHTIRPRILKRDGHHCTHPGCDTTTRLEVHHLGDDNDHRDEMLATLCHDCHARATAREAATARARTPRPSAKRPPDRHPGLKGGG